MIFFKIIAKNIRLLTRSRSTAAIMLLGPIIIISIVGFFFSGKSGYDLNIGYYAPQETEMTKDFISALEKSEFIAKKFGSEQECSDKIKQGLIHTCVIFPQNFEVKNTKTADVRFIVDYSRVNLVYKVIDSVSEILETETDAVSKSLTNNLLGEINETINGLASQEKKGTQLQKDVQDAIKASDESANHINSFTFSADSESMNNIYYNINKTNESIQEVRLKIGDVYIFSDSLIEELSDYIDSNRSGELRQNLHQLNISITEIDNETDRRIDALYAAAIRLSAAFDDIERQNERNIETNENLKASFSSAQESLNSLKLEINSFTAASYNMRRSLESIGITRADTIVSPVNTQIEPIALESTNFKSTFPFLVILLIMFASLMISSTLTIYERNSKAVFRNFMTPVHDKIFTSASLATVLIIVFLQSIIILTISEISMKVGIMNSLLVILLAVLFAASFFASLGMLIGNVFSSQEGAVMASLITGSAFMFISNLVVPLETIAPAISNIIKINPFVVLSEILRKAMIFGTGISEVLMPLAIIFWVAASIFLFIIIAKDYLQKKKRPEE